MQRGDAIPSRETFSMTTRSSRASGFGVALIRLSQSVFCTAGPTQRTSQVAGEKNSEGLPTQTRVHIRRRRREADIARPMLLSPHAGHTRSAGSGLGR